MHKTRRRGHYCINGVFTVSPRSDDSLFFDNIFSPVPKYMLIGLFQQNVLFVLFVNVGLLCQPSFAFCQKMACGLLKEIAC